MAKSNLESFAGNMAAALNLRDSRVRWGLREPFRGLLRPRQEQHFHEYYFQLQSI